jgi:glycerophosphoryl diester phosphodiesterase
MKRYIALLVVLVFSSCDDSVNVVYPDYDPSGFLEQTAPISILSKGLLDGIYEVTEGKNFFGDSVVLKWRGNFLSVFSSVNAGVIILEGGILDNSIFFKGFWRQILNENSGAVEMVITKDNGAEEIISGDIPDELVLSGTFGIGNNIPDTRIEMKYLRPIKPGLQDFRILSHRGGGRNSDYLGASENTIEMIRRAELFGANGVELDVRFSQDNIHFLYHDPEINLRLTQKTILKGQIEDFTFAQIRTFITLKNGEQIPSLREALEFIISETTLEFIWLDLKAKKNDIAEIAALREEFIQKAQKQRRSIEIFLGIPEEFKADQLKTFPGYSSIPTICELSPDKVRELNSIIWAPRWTEGLQTEEVLRLRAEGRRSIVWTLDQPDFIREYIYEGEFDGILSNYAPLVAYYHFTR